MKTSKFLAIVTLVAASAIGCGGSDSGDTADDTGAAATAASSPAASSPPATAATDATPSPTETIDLEADEIIKGLADAGMPAKLSVSYTAKTDPNDMLGKHGSYTSKAAFTDDRIDKSQVTDTSKGSVDLGGGVEVFDSNTLATGRANYLQAIESGSGGVFLLEYNFVAGGVLLRLSGALSASQAKDYQAALGQVVGVPASEVTVS